MRRRLSVVVDNVQRLEKVPHAIIDAETEFLTDVDMVLIACGQISQHRVNSRRQGHQIAWVGRHNLINTPAKIVETDIHMQR